MRYNSSGQGSAFASWGVWQPEAMVFDHSGNLYVANWYDNTIVKFDSGGHGSVFASGLDSPTGLAFDSAGNLYVANRDTPGTVVKFDPSGHGSVFASGLMIPSGIAVDRSDNVYVATGNDSNSIRRYDPTGHASVFASNINGGAEVLWGLTFDNSGNNLFAIVGNRFNGMIQEFDSSGHGSFFANMSDGLFIAIQPVPEPSSCVLLALAGGVFLSFRRLRHRPE
jgi:DNA-binding beta-propeller fold protein YncE